MRLAICREPHADEFLWGYLHELSELNGMSMWELQNMINNGDSVAAFSLRYPTGLPFVCDRIQNHTFPNLRRAMLMTPYFSDIIDCEDTMKIKLAEMVLQPKSPAFYRCKVDSIGNNVRICPKCWSEDIKKYGSGYVHLSHQFRNVCVCTKHKVQLGILEVEHVRETVKPLDVSKITMISVANIDTAYEYAIELENAFLENQFLLREVNCPKCGKRYLEHRQSKRMGTGCTFCNANRTPEQLINRRLRIRYGKNQYRVVPGFKGAVEAKIEHIPCHHIMNYGLERLLYGKEKQICKYCSNKEKLNDSYVVIGKYSDGCEKILHKKCGIAFKMKRSDFETGKRCPVCGVSWNFSSIKRKVEECCGNRYKLLKSGRKGYVYVLNSDNKLIAECSYACAMRDLMADTSRIFIKKRMRYVTKRDRCLQLFHEMERSDIGQERM